MTRTDGHGAVAPDGRDGHDVHNREWLERLIHAADEAAHALRTLEVPHQPDLLEDIERLRARLRVQLAELD
jgi:hypothetical protein